MEGPLSGVRVLDFTRVLAGPFCTMLLADLGADVIKVERPGRGDDTRTFPPFAGKESAYFININRNKRSIVINLKHPKGRELALELAKKSDVIVENFRPGTMEKLGLSYEDVKKVNPRIIYASISGFGQYGPYRDRPGYDLIGQAMGGIMSITGWPFSPPTRTGTAIADILAALFCCVGILSALRARDKTGEGRRIDVSLVDSVMSACEAYVEMYLVEGKVPTRIGNRYEFIYPYDTFEAKDGWIAIGIGNEEMWARFCKATNMMWMLEDPKFSTNEARLENHAEVKRVVEDWTRNKTVKEILDILLKYEIPCGPVYSMDEVCNDPHIAKAREMVVEIDQPNVGKMRIVGCPIKMTPTGASIRRPAPLLGQHTDEILKEVLGLSNEEIKRLREENVIS